MAMSTKLNRKASQEPESWCFPCSTSNSQEPNLETQITSSKSLNLFPLTNPRLPAISIPPNKSTTTGNKEAHSEIKNHELAQMNFYFTPQPPASNTPTTNLIPKKLFQIIQSQPTANNILIPKLAPTNYLQLSSQYSQIIPNLSVINFSNPENSPSSNLIISHNLIQLPCKSPCISPH